MFAVKIQPAVAGGWGVNVGVLLWLVLRSVVFAGERIAVDGREGILAQ